MSNTAMPHLATAPKPQKERLSLVLDFDKKQALTEIAQKQNRSLNFVVLEMIDRALQEAQEEAQYQEYIKNRVMQAYNEMKENGSQGVSSSEAKKIVMQRVGEKLENNQQTL